MASAESAGVTSGIATFQKIWNSLRPSIRAASMKSSGHRLEELPHQEDAEPGHHAGEHDAPVGVQPAEVLAT